VLTIPKTTTNDARAVIYLTLLFFNITTLTVRVELPDDGLYDSGALGDMSPAYWHAVTGGITHRASPPYSHVSGHAGAAGRVCGRPTALATGITGIIDGERLFTSGGGGVVLWTTDARSGTTVGATAAAGWRCRRRFRLRRRRAATKRVRGVAAVQLGARCLTRASSCWRCAALLLPASTKARAAPATPPPSRLAIAPESYRTIYNTFMRACTLYTYRRRRSVIEFGRNVG